MRQELIFAIQGKPPRRVELIFSNSVNQLDNERRCLTGALVDIEEQWQINQEILKAKQNAEELSQARTRFVANMSHEIRTPLNSIIGMTSVLEQSGLSEKQQSCLEAIKKGGHALLAVINDILDFAKLDYGEQEIEKIEFSWHELFEDVVDMLAADIEAKNLLFTLSCDSQIPETFVGDLHKLRRVLTNLLSNAIKFTSAGEISVTTLWTSDSDSAALDSEHSGWLTFCVSDSGIGIEPSRLQALFDPFTQADASVTRNYGGTGLGLAICKQICHSLGGAITVESVLNQGTKMTVKIPLSVSRGAADSASTACHRAIQAINARPRTIKVVSSLGLLQGLPVRVERNAKSGSSVRMITDETGFKPLQMEHEPAIYTPRRMQQRLQPQREGATKKQPAPTITRPLKILVAEDSKANQVVIKALLEHQGYLDVTLVNNGQEALDKFAEDPAELVLVDIHMPVMDGFTTSKTIREHKDWPQPVIYALTADVTTEAIAAAQAHGIDLWVTKPVTGEALRQALDKYPGFVDEAARADRITL